MGAVPTGATSSTTTSTSTSQPPQPPVPTADEKKQQLLADQTLSAAAASQSQTRNLPTLIDSDIETLYSGFQKQRSSQTPSPNPLSRDDDYQDTEHDSRRLRREEAKVKALNSNGRVDYSIQEGTFDISLLASIASHLGYWSDEDVNHFIISQILSRGRRRPGEIVS